MKQVNKVTYLLVLFFCSVLLANSQQLSQSVRVISGAVNGVSIERYGRKLVVYGDPKEELKESEVVLFTHFRRDVIWAGRKLVENGSQAVAPYQERDYFTNPASFWQDFFQSRYNDAQNQTTKIGILPVNVVHFVKGGELFRWQDLDIKVLSTPGYTRGSVSYIIDIDQQKFAFVGDLIYGDGKIFDLYSFQDSLGKIGGYHGYATRLGQLCSSLMLIAGEQPDYIVPSRGPVISDPRSIERLISRVRSAYENYLTITAYRWYYPERTEMLSEHVLGSSAIVEPMSYSKVIREDSPSWCMRFNTSWIIFAEDSSAFLMDCGSQGALDKVLELKRSGHLKTLDGIFITHYHSDHVTFINEAVKEFGCPLYVIEEVRDILENPSAYHMPVLINDPITDLTVMDDGQKMSWKDYSLTFYYFPGQTLYHGALLFEKDNGETVFFIGDSFTPSGIDDYCLLNRNFLHPETGYLYCIDLLKKLPGNVLLANQHVDPLFTFSRQQLNYMENLLNERRIHFKNLFPWDNINYALDEQWVRFYPYGQKANPGEIINFEVKVFNHSDETKIFILEPNVPEGFNVDPEITSVTVDPVSEGVKLFRVKIPANVQRGVSLFTVDVSFENQVLHEWAEGICITSD